MKIKFREVIFGVIFILIGIITVGKYITPRLTNEDIFSYLETKVVEYRNNNLQRFEINPVSIENYTIVKNVNGNWDLYKNNEVSHDYIVADKNGKIEILNNGSNKKLSIQIDGLTTYNSNVGIVNTDIPYAVDLDSIFFIHEQEDLFPIIGYHNIYKDENNIVDPEIDMREKDFLDQIWLFNNQMNCQWIRFGDVVEKYLSKNIKLPRNTCVMTFDDGRSNNHDVVLPILDSNKIVATFNIIAGRIGQKSYLSNFEVSDIFLAGNEIGSHSLTGGSLIDTSWFTEGPFTIDVLRNQLNGARLLLNKYGYGVKTFAIPLGDYDENIIKEIQDSGYIGARASKKKNAWRDKRALATSLESDNIWHLNYYEPELESNEEIYKDIHYNGFWQFEEGFGIIHDGNNSIKIITQSLPTDESYGGVLLDDNADSIDNPFILEGDGSYQIDMLIGQVDNPNLQGPPVFFVDGISASSYRDDLQTCLPVGKLLYCHYVIKTNLSAGRHTLTTNNKDSQSILDRFSIKKEVKSSMTYYLTIKRFE